MKKKLTLLALQIKSAFISIPKIILGTMVIGFFVVLLSVGIGMASSRDNDERMKVAVVYPEHNEREENSEFKYIKMALNYVSEIDTVSNVCTFEYTSRDEAIRGLRDERYVMAVMVPEKLISGIMSGENTPIEVVYSSEGVNNTSMIFREMLSAGGSDLATAQAGIYTFDDLFYGILRGYKSQMKSHEDKLNEIYLSYALNRSIYFETRDISVKDGLSTVQFYVCTGIVMLLILSGITCAANLKGESRAMNMSIKAQGIHAYEWGICKTTGLALIYSGIFLVLFIFANAFRARVPALSNVLTVSSFAEMAGSFLGILVLVYAVFSFIYCIFTIVKNPVYSVLTLFILGMLFMYSSGCFVSSSLLPSGIRSVGAYLPTAGFFRLAGQIIKGTVGAAGILINVLWIFIFQAIAALAMRIRRNA